jgi:tRNA(Ile)-lysidine synthase
VKERVEIEARKAFASLLPEGARLLVAVSGGGDSVALLRLLLRFRDRFRWRLIVAHLAHGLRRGSGEDRQFVERLAARAGVPCVADRRWVRRLRRRDESPEEAARRVRREFLLDTAANHRCDRIVTGHTLDDQAETILMRLARGAGPLSIGGMSPSGPGPFVKPLLGLERSEIRDYLARHRARYREDPSNRRLRFDRNRTRHLVVPILASELNPRAARNVVRAVDRIREDAEYLDLVARVLLGELRAGSGTRRFALEASLLARAPLPIARRVALLALWEAGGDPRRIGSRHVEAVLDLCRGAAGKSRHLPGGLVAERTIRRVVVSVRPERGRQR